MFHMPILKLNKSTFGIKSDRRRTSRTRSSGIMSPSIFSQTKALVWRYCIATFRSPIKSSIRIIIWPTFLIAITIYLLNNLDRSEESYVTHFENHINPLIFMLTIFHVWAFSEWLVTDKATNFKSLMFSMGLERISYYLGNALCFIACVLPLMIIVCFISIIHIFTETYASSIAILLMFILFVIHLVGVIFALTSFITSTNFVSIIPVLLLFQGFIHNGILRIMKKSPASLRPLVLFIASLSPYESIKIFCSSYTVCKNCDRTQLSGDGEFISQPTYLILVAMAFWTLVAFAFARWFDEVCPWQNDTAVKGPCFCCKSASHYEEIPCDEDEAARGSKYFEQCIANREVGIRISKLTKKFKSRPVVDDVTFNIYKGETTLLLGHNGAGKTTLMNMILGKLTPDHGKTMFRDLSGCISDNREGLQIGVCPQTSILDDNLNVKQHIELFADIKFSGMSRAEYASHINTTLEDVSLTAHAFKLPTELSGGMKRKLSLAMAFVGKSSVLILDEPSSGLDPDSRVFIWNAIRRFRSDKTVLLSTQHMEEADYLGDRIAIMKDGKIICCGSSTFLNKTFGAAYKLRVECHASKRKQVLTFIRKYFDKAKPSENDCVSVPPHQSSDPVVDTVIELVSDKSKDSELNLISLLEEIEKDSKALNIMSHSLKSSSIEDVLLNTNRSFSCESQANAVQVPLTSTSGHIAALANPQRVTNSRLSSREGALLKALVIKHVHTYIMDWKSIAFYRLIIPLVLIYYLVRNLNVPTTAKGYKPELMITLMIWHFVYYPTQERVSKFKTMQLTSQASFTIYWLSQLIVDCVTIVILCIGANIFLEVALNVKFVSRFEVHSLLTIATFLFGISAALIAYVLSTIFTDPKTSVGYHIILYCTSSIASTIVTIVQLASKTDLTWLSQAFDLLFVAILPTDALNYILFAFNIECYIEGRCEKLQSFSRVEYSFVALCAQCVVFGGLLYFIEVKNLDPSKYFNLRYLCASKPPQPKDIQETDQDVIAESTKAMRHIGSVPAETYSLVAADLSKSHIPAVKVVNHLSFTVHRGECFGLLGVNGAGKTTTFSMVVAEIKPDSGRIWVNGYYNKEDVDTYRHQFGYGPQSNPDMSLKATDALYLMARLRRVDEKSIPEQVNSILELLDMGEHAKKSSKELSGGTKRKLALGMSLIGNPQLLALDEPTAGVDPIARRSIWQLLKSLRTQNGASIVISSHAMEECEAICDRISIMARGRLRCIGTFLHLRSKFAQGCTVKVQFSVSTSEGSPVTASNERIISDLNRRLHLEIGPSMKFADSNVNSATFNISDNKVRRSTVFKILREFRLKHPRMSYILNDASLEDIFINLAREQEQLEGNNSFIVTNI